MIGDNLLSVELVTLKGEENSKPHYQSRIDHGTSQSTLVLFVWETTSRASLSSLVALYPLRQCHSIGENKWVYHSSNR